MKYLIAAGLLLMAVEAFAVDAYLVREVRTKGSPTKTCEYMNGVILTVKADDPCPYAIADGY